VHTFFGRVFDNPVSVFSEAILKPETQDAAVYADGVCNIVEAIERVARAYFEDNSIEDACPPLRALLHVMAYGNWEGKDASHPEFRRLFTRESLLESDWYKERLRVKQARDGKVKVGKLDVDDSPVTAGKFGVRGVPTIMVFKNGQRAAQHVGLTTKAKLLELVNG
jgi:thiol-disulfide isomerase/thioredoxin